MEQAETPIEGRGRSAKKREAKAIEQLAQRMADLPEAKIAKLDLSQELDHELRLARNTRGHSSRKRQIKHLAGFLRRNDELRGKLEADLEGFSLTQRRETLAFHSLEQLRDQLCNPDDFPAALDEVHKLYPLLDTKKLAGLARSVHTSNDKKAYREIFRRLRNAAEMEAGD
ncbi:MAG: DUF615 domain-containing protein [Desulfuromonadales bacterium]|jgi:ribosome-associated protein|nr:DUF615 domain-containing protein [Desulfuromonadales bacterium]